MSTRVWRAVVRTVLALFGAFALGAAAANVVDTPLVAPGKRDPLVAFSCAGVAASMFALAALTRTRKV